MEQIPKIARVRMAVPVAGAHLEAELLNAFAENALVAKEREGVLAHLAECTHCREIVSLAAAARPEGAPLAKPARGGFRWAMFQWAAVAASAAIVTVAVLVVGPKETRGPQPANRDLAVRQTERETAPSAPEASRASDETLQAPAKPDASATANARVARKTPSGVVISGGGAGSASGGGFGGGVYRVQQDEKANVNSLAKLEEKKEGVSREPAAKAPVSQAMDYSVPGPRPADGFVAGTVAANQPVPKTAEANKQVAAAAPPPPATDGERGRTELQTKTGNELAKDKRADPGASAEASSESVQVTSPARSTHYSEKMASGKKARAQVMTGAASPSSSFDSAGRAWRVQSGKLQSSDDGGTIWQVRDTLKNVQLTSVAALGQQVWAGGKAGALYVSMDSGDSWRKVSLTGDDVMPLGDVAAIKIASVTLMDVLLSTGDDWQSNDGGKSFRLLPRKP